MIAARYAWDIINSDTRQRVRIALEVLGLASRSSSAAASVPPRDVAMHFASKFGSEPEYVESQIPPPGNEAEPDVVFGPFVWCRDTKSVVLVRCVHGSASDDSTIDEKRDPRTRESVEVAALEARLTLQYIVRRFRWQCLHLVLVNRSPRVSSPSPGRFSLLLLSALQGRFPPVSSPRCMVRDDAVWTLIKTVSLRPPAETSLWLQDLMGVLDCYAKLYLKQLPPVALCTWYGDGLIDADTFRNGMLTLMDAATAGGGDDRGKERHGQGEPWEEEEEEQTDKKNKF